MMKKRPPFKFYQSCKYFECDELENLKPEDTCNTNDIDVCTNSYCNYKKTYIDKCNNDCSFYTSIYKEYCKSKCPYYSKEENKCVRRFSMHNI